MFCNILHEPIVVYYYISSLNCKSGANYNEFNKSLKINGSTFLELSDFLIGYIILILIFLIISLNVNNI